MRIISGTHKGRRIIPDKSFKARPTTDFAKENLFNVLNHTIDITGISALDLFGGTGGISYELASRGAAQVTCVEINFKHISFIKKTVADLKFNNISVLRADTFRFLKSCNKKYDLIFADPPYDLDKIETLPDIVFEKELLLPDGLLILEHGKDHNFENHDNFIEMRTYGSVNFSFFKGGI